MRSMEIGRELGVHYLVEGTLRREDQRWRVAATLVRTRDQLQVWTEGYDRSLAERPALELEMAATIARQAGVAVPSQARSAVATSTHDPDAHDLYLRGRWYWHQRRPEAMLKAEQCFQEAIAKAPSYAPAHAALADTYVLQIMMNAADATDRWTRARRAVGTALQLNPTLGEAHAAAAITDFYVGWDWAAAERSFRRAIELNPNDAIAHQFYAQLLSNSLRHDEAIAEIERARAIDPLAPIMHTFAAMMYAWPGRHDAGFAAVRHALTLDPDHFPAHAVLGHLYDRTGDPDAALASYRTAHRLSRGNVFMLGFQGSVLGRTGRNDDGRQIVATLEQIARSRHVAVRVRRCVRRTRRLRCRVSPSRPRLRAARRVPHHAPCRALVGPTSFRHTIRPPATADRVAAGPDGGTLRPTIAGSGRGGLGSRIAQVRGSRPRGVGGEESP